MQNLSASDTRYYHRAPPQNQQEKRAPKMKKPYKPEPSPESTTEQAAEEAAPLKKHRLKRHLPTMTTLMMTALAGSIGKKAYRIHAA